MKNFQRSIIMSVLKSYRSKSFELTLERDPTSDSYALFARDSFLDPIRKDPAFIQFMTEMKAAGKVTAANLD
jgi:hypothetical protein